MDQNFFYLLYTNFIIKYKIFKKIKTYNLRKLDNLDKT